MPDDYNYPPGADADPRAPWNEEDDITCPNCGSDDIEAGEEAEFRCYKCSEEFADPDETAKSDHDEGLLDHVRDMERDR